MDYTAHGISVHAFRGSRRGWIILVACVAILLNTPIAFADLWYEHYDKAETAIQEQDWVLAVEQINEAIERKGDSGARVRSYGMKVISYFPYYKLGVAYYHLGQFDAALQAFETETRLGAIANSDEMSVDLERYQGLALAAQKQATAEEQGRIQSIVERSLADAQDLEGRGLLDGAIAAVDRALAVSPDHSEALITMNRLRQLFAEQELEKELEMRVNRLLEDGKTLLGERQFNEASSLFKQALFLKPGPEIQNLVDFAQSGLLAEIEAGRRAGDRLDSIARELEEVRQMESAGQLSAALDRLQSILALEPSNQDAREIQGRLLQVRRDQEAQSVRQALIDELLAEADGQIEAGAAEAALSAANRTLAVDPGNESALRIIARAYALISQKLLGTGPAGNIPPAIRFVDLREEDEDGSLVQVTDTASFRLDGVIIDNSLVEVRFYDSADRMLGSAVNAQPLGEFYLTEFHLESELQPGRSTFRLLATDSQELSSSSEYTVIYTPPFYRAAWFYALLSFGGLALIAGYGWRRARKRERLRTRKFNPYIAGAPVLEDELFFGRQDLLDRILQTIHNNSLLIYGERRIGKTSIQHQLKKRLGELDDPDYEFYPVYVDLQGIPESRFFQTIAGDIFEELAPVLGDLQPLNEIAGDYAYREFILDVRSVLKAITKQTRKKVKLVLLIDEVDEMNQYDPRVNQQLRSLFMKSFAENLVAVVSGVQIKKEWEREGSPWYNFFEEIEVKPFGPRDARELIERPIGGMFKMEDGVVEKIISLTAGKPYLIQKICVSLVSRLHEQQRRRITVADVEVVARPDGG